MTRHVFEEGTISLIHGPPGTGKTNLGMLFAHRAQQLSKNILLNIQASGVKYRPCYSDVQFFNRYLELGEDIFFVLDETNLFQSSKNAKGEQEKQLEMFVSLIRHFRASLVFIIQRRRNFMPMLREQSWYEFKKHEKKVMEIYNIKGQSDSYTDIPPCEDFGVEFETYSFATFEFKLDLKDLVKDLAGKSTKQAKKELYRIAKDRYNTYRLEH